MFAISLGDGAELGLLEPWQAEEYFAHIERGRAFIGQYIGLADAARDLGSARAFLQSYADKQAADGGRIFGIRIDGTLVGGVLFPASTPQRAAARSAAGWSPQGSAGG